jgi:hypothetical protein
MEHDSHGYLITYSRALKRYSAVMSGGCSAIGPRRPAPHRTDLATTLVAIADEASSRVRAPNTHPRVPVCALVPFVRGSPVLLRAFPVYAAD